MPNNWASDAVTVIAERSRVDLLRLLTGLRHLAGSTEPAAATGTGGLPGGTPRSRPPPTDHATFLRHSAKVAGHPGGGCGRGHRPAAAAEQRQRWTPRHARSCWTSM